MHTYAESKRPRTQNLTDSGLTLFGGNSKRNEQVVRPVKSNPERVCTQCNSTCRLPVSACLLNRSAVADGYVPALYTSEPARASKRARKQEREREGEGERESTMVVLYSCFGAKNNSDTVRPRSGRRDTYTCSTDLTPTQQTPIL